MKTDEQRVQEAASAVSRTFASPTILVWRFYDAPASFQALSKHGGDETWIAYVPLNYERDVPWTDGFGRVEYHSLLDGAQILIGFRS